MEYGSLNIGKFRLVCLTERVVDEAIGQLRSRVNATTWSDDGKNGYLVPIARELKELKDQVRLKHRVIAEAGRARQIAEEEARRILDLLIYVGGAQTGAVSGRTAVGLRGEVAGGSRAELSIQTNGVGFRSSEQAVGPFFPAVLSPRHQVRLEQLGFFVVSGILNNVPPHDSFDDIILRALHWFASGITQSEAENALLNIITCLETFFGQGSAEPIQTSVAEGVAFVLGADKEQRIGIKKLVKDVYATRSRLSHGGKRTVNDGQMSEVIQLAGTLLSRMIERRAEFSSKQQLLDWIEDRRLS